MKTVFFKSVAIFFILLVATSVMMDTFKMDFGTVDFFQRHGVFFLIFITIFPRLTLFFSSVASGGLVWWLGFFFCPRLLVATLATVTYFHTNPILVIISWLVALGGEVMEKWGVGGRKNRFVFRTYSTQPQGAYQAPAQPELKKDDAIEVEFTKH
jgi:hypothetical protein